MNRSQAEEITHKVLSLSDADETEVILAHSEENLTRFSGNTISQNVSRRLDNLTVKVHLGKKVGRASTDRFDETSLRRVVEAAKTVASQQKDDPDLLSLSGPAQFAVVDPFYEQTIQCSPSFRATTIAGMVHEAEKNGAEIAGVFQTGGESIVLGNSKGLFAYHRSTNALLSCTAEINGATGWAEDHQRDIGKINTRDVIETALRKASEAQNPVPVDPGEYTVVLEPAAVSDFLLFMGWEGFGGLNFVEGRSFLSGKIGQRVLGENVTLIDDAYHDLNPGLPFDFEGLPRQKVVLIEKGIARSAVHDRLTAAKAGTNSTGHSLPQPNSTGPLPLNLIMEPGDSDLQEMIASTDRGLLVTHFHYTNILDPVQLLLTGMTRDGTFLIENGEITKPVKNLRFTESLVKAFNEIEMISRERKATEAFFEGSFVTPALKINRFTFSSISEF